MEIVDGVTDCHEGEPIKLDGVLYCPICYDHIDNADTADLTPAKGD